MRNHFFLNGHGRFKSKLFNGAAEIITNSKFFKCHILLFGYDFTKIQQLNETFVRSGNKQPDNNRAGDTL